MLGVARPPLKLFGFSDRFTHRIAPYFTSLYCWAFERVRRGVNQGDAAGAFSSVSVPPLSLDKRADGSLLALPALQLFCSPLCSWYGVHAGEKAAPGSGDLPGDRGIADAGALRLAASSAARAAAALGDLGVV